MIYLLSLLPLYPLTPVCACVCGGGAAGSMCRKPWAVGPPGWAGRFRGRGKSFEPAQSFFRRSAVGRLGPQDRAGGAIGRLDGFGPMLGQRRV